MFINKFPVSWKPELLNAALENEKPLCFLIGRKQEKEEFNVSELHKSGPILLDSMKPVVELLKVAALAPKPSGDAQDSG